MILLGLVLLILGLLIPAVHVLLWVGVVLVVVGALFGLAASTGRGRFYW